MCILREMRKWVRQFLAYESRPEMPRIGATAERIIDAEPAAVWAAITDFSGAHAQILPSNYQDFTVEGSAGDVTLSFRLRAGGRERVYRMRVEESAPEQELIERDQGSSYLMRWHVERVGPGAHTRVRLASEWESRTAGVNGFFERRFAPMGIRRIHQETLVRLGQFMRAHEPATAGR